MQRGLDIAGGKKEVGKKSGKKASGWLAGKRNRQQLASGKSCCFPSLPWGRHGLLYSPRGALIGLQGIPKKCQKMSKKYEEKNQQIPKNTKQILNVMPRRPILLPEGDSDRVARVEAIDTTSANHHKSKSPQEQITTSANHHKRKSPQEQITTSGKNWGNQNLPWRTNFGFPRNTKISLLSRFLCFGRGIDLSKIC